MLFPGEYHHITGTVDFHENPKQVPFIKIKRILHTHVVTRIWAAPKIYMFNFWPPYLLQWFFKTSASTSPESSLSSHSLQPEFAFRGEIGCESWIYPKLAKLAHLSPSPVVGGSLVSRTQMDQGDVLWGFSFPNGQFWCQTMLRGISEGWSFEESDLLSLKRMEEKNNWRNFETRTPSIHVITCDPFSFFKADSWRN